MWSRCLLLLFARNLLLGEADRQTPRAVVGADLGPVNRAVAALADVLDHAHPSVHPGEAFSAHSREQAKRLPLPCPGSRHHGFQKESLK